MELTRVSTKLLDDGMLFTMSDGTSAVHRAYFKFNGREYFFLSGFYYDLETPLIDHIFRR